MSPSGFDLGVFGVANRVCSRSCMNSVCQIQLANLEKASLPHPCSHRSFSAELWPWQSDEVPPWPNLREVVAIPCREKFW